MRRLFFNVISFLALCCVALSALADEAFPPEGLYVGKARVSHAFFGGGKLAVYVHEGTSAFILVGDFAPFTSAGEPITHHWEMDAYYDVVTGLVVGTLKTQYLNSEKLLPVIGTYDSARKAFTFQVLFGNKVRMTVRCPLLSEGPAIVGKWKTQDGTIFTIEKLGGKNRYVATYSGLPPHEALKGRLTGKFDGTTYQGTGRAVEGRVVATGTFTLTFLNISPPEPDVLEGKITLKNNLDHIPRDYPALLQRDDDDLLAGVKESP